MPRSRLEAADVLGIGRTKLFELQFLGTLESVQIGHSRRVSKDAVGSFLAGLRAEQSRSSAGVHRERSTMSIESRRRKRDGRIVYDVRLRDPDGREYSRTFPTKKAAEAYEAKERVDRNRGAWVDPRKADTPLGELAKAWLQSNPGKTESCATKDEGIVRNHINPILGARPVGSINRRDVQSLVAGWSHERGPERSVASSTFCERSSTTR